MQFIRVKVCLAIVKKTMAFFVRYDRIEKYYKNWRYFYEEIYWK